MQKIISTTTLKKLVVRREEQSQCSFLVLLLSLHLKPNLMFSKYNWGNSSAGGGGRVVR
jgi:hypothetical protein